MMRKLFRCRRASVSLMVSLAAVPMIGMAGLGAEAGSWYLIRRAEQNAADAAALAGALSLISNNESALVGGTAFARRNGWCDGCAPMTGATQHVNITNTTTSVTARLEQDQPLYLAALFVAGRTAIKATAVATIRATNNCALATNGLTIGGSAGFSGTPCTLASNTTLSTTGNAASFTSPGWLLEATEGCPGNHCTPANTTQNYSALAQSIPPALQSLETTCASQAACALNTSGAWPALNVNAAVSLGAGTNGCSASGKICFFSSVSVGTKGKLNTNGFTVVIGNGGLSTNGNATITAQAPTTGAAPGVAIYDTESGNLKFNGNTSFTIGGGVFFPNANVTWNGNSSTSLSGSAGACSEIVASQITFTGNTGLNMSGCSGVPSLYTQYAVLTQ